MLLLFCITIRNGDFMKQNDFENAPMLRLVMGLAIPSMIAQLVNILYSIVDRMFVGQIDKVGNLCLGAVGICGPIVTLLSSFGTLVGIGGSIWLSISLGQKDEKKARQILFNSFIMLVIISLGLTFLFILFKKHLIYWFGGSDALFPYANTYLTIYTLGTFFALMSIGLNYFLTSQGYSTIAMVSVCVGAITNIVFDLVFIKILEIGVAGAAVGTVIAQVLSCFFEIFFLRYKSKIQLHKENLSFEMMKRIATLGFSPFLINASDSVILIVMNGMLQKYGGNMGDVYISAVTIAQSYFLLITGPLLGISSGTQPIYAYHFGAKNLEKIRQAFKIILTFGFLFCLAMFIVSMCFSNVFVSLFTSDKLTMPIASRAIKIFCLGILLMSIQYVLVDGITALSHVKLSLFLSLNRKIMYFLCTLFLPMFFGISNIFYAQPIADVYASIVTMFCFIKIIPSYLKSHGVQ